MLYAKFTATEMSPEAMNRVIIGKCLIFLNFISFISFMYKTIPAHTYIGVAKKQQAASITQTEPKNSRQSNENLIAEVFMSKAVISFFVIFIIGIHHQSYYLSTAITVINITFKSKKILNFSVYSRFIFIFKGRTSST